MSAEGFKKYASNGTTLTVAELQKWMKDIGATGAKVDNPSVQAAFEAAKSDPKYGQTISILKKRKASKHFSMKAPDLDKFVGELAEKYKEDKKLSNAAQAKTELLGKFNGGGAAGGGASGQDGCCNVDPCCPPSCPTPQPQTCPPPSACPLPPACPPPPPPCCPPPSFCPCPDCGGFH